MPRLSSTPLPLPSRPFALSAPVFCGLILAAVLAVYWPALQGEFVWDDASHVTRADLRSLDGLGRIWFEIGATQQYYPLLHSAFWVEYQLWGDAPLGYHLINVVLHAAAAGLLWALLRRLAVPGAWLAAFLFALHPVCVESVAWISEQKNTLSTVLYLTATLAYLKRHGQSRPPLFWYFVATGFFLCALLTKTVTATLPAALLVLIWWQRGRLAWRGDVLPLLPWFALGAASGLLTAWFEHSLIGASGAEFELTAIERILLAGRVVWFYLGKLLWPANLTFIYPRWEIDAAVWWQWLFPLAALALLVALWRIARARAQPAATTASAWSTVPRTRVDPVAAIASRLQTREARSSPTMSASAPARPRFPASGRARRAPLAVALLFGGTLFPVLGFFNVFPFLYSFVADHFQYLASLPVFAAAGAGLTLTLGMTQSATAGHRSSLRGVLRGFALIVLLAALGSLTWRQGQMYRDVFVLFETTIARNPGAWMAYNNLGIAHAGAGRFHEAISLYERSLALNPKNAGAENNLGSALTALQRHADALPHFQRALELQPDLTPVYNNLGRALLELGRNEEGLAAFTDALGHDPRSADAHYNLGLALARLGETERAITHFESAAALNPNDPAAQLNWAVGLMLIERFPEAEPHFKRALALDPSSRHAHFAYGRALAENGRDQDAVVHLRTALELAPEYSPARSQLLQVLRRLGRDAEAQHYEAQ